MRKLLQNPRVQKAFLPLAFAMIFAVWCIAEWGNPFRPVCYVMAALGLLFFILDRQLKPREHERAARKLEQNRATAQKANNETQP